MTPHGTLEDIRTLVSLLPKAVQTFDTEVVSDTNRRLFLATFLGSLIGS